MEIYLPAGCGVPRRVAGGDDGIQNPAGALGQGTDPDGKEDSAPGVAQRCAAAYKDRSLVSLNGEPELSANDCALGTDTASDDHPFLSGMVSDALHRPAAVPGFNVFHFELLSGFAARTLSQELAASAAVSAVPYGPRHRVDYYEYESRD